MREYFLIALFIFLISCSRNHEGEINRRCLLSAVQFQSTDSNKLAVGRMSDDGKVAQLVDKSNDSLNAGVYNFYPNGNLQSYRFFTSRSEFSYNEEYDSLGNLLLIEGSPLVLHGSRKVDSSIIRFTYFFSALNKEIRGLTIKTSSGFKFDASLYNNSVFTNMKSTSFDLPIAKGYNDVEIYAECLIVNNCLGKEWTLRDTLKLNNVILFNELK